MSADPWKHRSEGMRCRTCMYFVLKVPQERVPVPLQETDPPLTANGNLGRCRRHAPTMSGFPAVFQGDWCGDHKLNENSL